MIFYLHPFLDTLWLMLSIPWQCSTHFTAHFHSLLPHLQLHLPKLKHSQMFWCTKSPNKTLEVQALLGLDGGVSAPWLGPASSHPARGHKAPPQPQPQPKSLGLHWILPLQKVFSPSKGVKHKFDGKGFPPLSWAGWDLAVSKLSNNIFLHYIKDEGS